MIRFAILSFPGSKLEPEMALAFQRNGMEAVEIGWIDSVMSDGGYRDFDGYCIVGKSGDGARGRAAAIAAREPMMEFVKREAAKGKVVLGIGMGAEVLVESGLIPGYENGEVACALVWRGIAPEGRGAESGLKNRGVHLKNIAPRNRSAFNAFGDLLVLPYGHGEGKFVFGDGSTERALKANGQILFQYCDEKGKVKGGASQGHMGSADSIAALCNPAGNVMAIISNPARDPLGGADAIFKSVREWIEEGRKADQKTLGKYQAPEDVRAFEPADLEFLVRQRQEDHEERSMEAAVRKLGFKVGMTRYDYWAVKLFMGMEPEAMALQIIQSGILADLRKEWVTVRIGKGIYHYSKKGDLQPAEVNPDRWVVVRNRFDAAGETMAEEIRKQVRKEIDSIRYGVLWDIEKADEQALYGIIRTKILYNPNSMYILKN